MARVSKQMQIIDEELARLEAEISRLSAKREALVDLRAKINGEPAVEAKPTRKRSGSVKPLVIDYLHRAGFTGATSAEVDEAVRLTVSDVAKYTVGSILSRLKSDGIFVYVGDRYYEKQYAPRGDNPFESELRAVN